MERPYNHVINLIDYIHYSKKIEILVKDQGLGKICGSTLIEKIKAYIDINAHTVGYFFAYLKMIDEQESEAENDEDIMATSKTISIGDITERKRAFNLEQIKTYI